MVKNKKIDNITICGGALTVDFINTVRDRVTTPLPDYLDSFSDLLYWALRIELIDNKKFREISEYAGQHPKKAAAFFDEAVATRELLYQLLHFVSQQREVPGTLLDNFYNLTAKYFPFLKLEQQDGTFVEKWDFESGSFMYILAPIVKDGYELLLNAQLERLKECPKCAWLFLDTTRNGKRRWCSMKTCGSNVKALEWYYRKQKETK